MGKNEELPQIEGYVPDKKTISILAANIWAILLMVVAGIFGFVAIYALRGGFSDLHSWSGVILLLAIIAALVVHELIHGITWMILVGKGFSHVSFGLMKGAVYCHFDAPMIKSQYVIGALMPLVLVGVVPWIAGIAAGSLLWMAIGAIMIGGAAGDIMIVWTIRKEPASALVYDHPNEAGCYVYHKND